LKCKLPVGKTTLGCSANHLERAAEFGSAAGHFIPSIIPSETADDQPTTGDLKF
jgi:hypothetical protein